MSHPNPYVYWHTRSGFCQVHYRRRRTDKGYDYFCAQSYFGRFRWMTTSRDGEPSHPVEEDWNKVPYPDPGEDTSTDEEFREFLKMEKQREHKWVQATPRVKDWLRDRLESCAAVIVDSDFVTYAHIDGDAYTFANSKGENTRVEVAFTSGDVAEVKMNDVDTGGDGSMGVRFSDREVMMEINLKFLDHSHVRGWEAKL